MPGACQGPSTRRSLFGLLLREPAVPAPPPRPPRPANAVRRLCRPQFLVQLTPVAPPSLRGSVAKAVPILLCSGRPASCRRSKTDAAASCHLFQWRAQGSQASTVSRAAASGLPQYSTFNPHFQMRDGPALLARPVRQQRCPRWRRRPIPCWPRPPSQSCGKPAAPLGNSMGSGLVFCPTCGNLLLGAGRSAAARVGMVLGAQCATFGAVRGPGGEPRRRTTPP